jgi:Tol biopolymer transport system component
MSQRYVLALVLALVLGLILAACGGGTATTTTAGQEPTTTDSLVTTTTSDSPTSTPEGSTTTSIEGMVPFDPSKLIAFQGVSTRGTEGVVLIHPDGSGEMEVPAPDGVFWQLPDWSPAGDKIVVTSRGSVPELLYVYDLAADTAEPLFACEDPCVGDDDPAYSPDGSKVVFVRYHGPFVNDAPADCGLWIGDLTSLEAIRLTTNENCDREYAPRVSPDGEQIVYFRWRDPGPEQNAVFVIDSTGGEERQLTEWDQVAGYPDWSPDGEWIVFTTHPDWDTPGISNLYRMRPDGTAVEQLTFYSSNAFRASQPRYTPDGQWILFTGVTPGGRDMMAIPADGGEPIPIFTGGIYTHSTLQP